MNPSISAVFIGASAGGVTAIQRLLAAFTQKISVPVVVIQHLPQDAKLNSALIYGRSTALQFEDIVDKMTLQGGYVYFAPPSYHLLVEKDCSLSLSQDEPVHYSRPSIDVSFESAALAFGKSLCGVLLTGGSSDGALGLKAIHKAGGYTIVQDPDDAEVAIMPKSALELFKPDVVGSLREISELLVRLL